MAEQGYYLEDTKESVIEIATQLYYVKKEDLEYMRKEDTTRNQCIQRLTTLRKNAN